MFYFCMDQCSTALRYGSATMNPRTRRSGRLASRKDRSDSSGQRTLVAASPTDTQGSLAGNQAVLDRFLLWGSLRGATLVVTMLAAFVFGLGSASLARAASPGELTALTPAFVEAGEGTRSEEHTSELQSLRHIVCRL